MRCIAAPQPPDSTMGLTLARRRGPPQRGSGVRESSRTWTGRVRPAGRSSGVVARRRRAICSLSRARTAWRAPLGLRAAHPTPAPLRLPGSNARGGLLSRRRAASAGERKIERERDRARERGRDRSARANPRLAGYTPKKTSLLLCLLFRLLFALLQLPRLL